MNLKLDRLGPLLSIGAVVGGLLIAARILRSSEVRDGISWALGTWFRPPDADAGWEQRASAGR
jgi:hypothetical protein